MNKEWFTAAELASKPGLPATESGTIRKAKRESWKSQKRQARGGGLEYHISSLPAETQAAIRAQQIDNAAAADISITEFLEDTDDQKLKAFEQKKAREAAMAKFVALPAAKKERARAKEWLIHEANLYIEANQHKRIDGLQHFCSDLSDSLIIVPNTFKPHLTQLHGHVHLHPSTLRDWEKKFKEKGIAALVDNYGTRKGKSKIAQNQELKKIVLACLNQQPHITGKKVKAYLEAAHAELNIVSAKSIDRFLTGWKKDNHHAWVYATNPDKWKNELMPAFGSHHESITRPNQLWELDSTPGDWMLTDGRHSVIGTIDMYTRKLKLLVSKTSKASAVCQVVRKAIKDWGVPEMFRTDNGKDYISEQFVTFARDLEIPIDLCNPFASEEKGTVERAFRTMSHGILDLLPGFIGHNVADRKVIEARKSFASRILKKDEVVEVALSSAELQEKLDQWTEHVYMHDEHAGLDGQTPWEVDSSWTGTLNRITDDRALDMLLAEVAGIRTITKKGIALDRHHYIAQELGHLVGSEVRLRRDESDIGNVFVYQLDGEYICQAKCHKILGISSAEAATAAKSSSKKFAAQQRQNFKENKKYIQGNISEVVIKHRIEQSQNVTAMPHKSQEYTTPALTAASEAANHKLQRRPEPTGLTEREKQIQTQLEKKLSQPAEVIEIHDTPEQRYARAYYLERREHLSEADAQWLKGYQGGTEYSSRKKFYESFGQVPKWHEAGK